MDLGYLKTCPVEAQSVLLLGLHPHIDASLGTAAQAIQTQLAVGRHFASNKRAAKQTGIQGCHHSYYQSTAKLLNSAKFFSSGVHLILKTHLPASNFADYRSIPKTPFSLQFSKMRRHCLNRQGQVPIKSRSILQRC